MILLHQLHKAYHAPWNRSGRVVAVKNMSLQVAAGECFGLLGANGAGKTSTLSVVTGQGPFSDLRSPPGSPIQCAI